MPKERLEKALAATAQAADRRAGSGGQLHGRPVKVVDASTTQLADTRKNQRRYPQPSAQKPGCGFPVLKFVVLFSLTSGAILNVILGSLHHHDLRLLRGLWDQLKKGDILLGDRAYGEYTTLATGPQQGVDVVARLHARRKVDFRKARRLGKNDGLFVWTKGYQQSEILSATEWSLLPAQITVRIIRFTATIRGFRARRITLVTTLLDPSGLSGARLDRPLCAALAVGTVSARPQNDDGHGTAALQIPGHGRKGTLGLSGRAQPHPLPDGRSGRSLPSGFGTGQLQGQRRCPAPVQRRHRPKLATKRCAANSGRTCCSTSRATWSAIAPTAKNLGPSNADPNPIRCSINRAATSWKSPTAAATGKAAPAIIAALTKGHSCQSSLLTLIHCWYPGVAWRIHPHRTPKAEWRTKNAE